jgi:hypothetical protein
MKGHSEANDSTRHWAIDLRGGVSQGGSKGGFRKVTFFLTFLPTHNSAHSMKRLVRF